MPKKEQATRQVPERRVLPCMLAGQWAQIDWTEEVLFVAGKFKGHRVAQFHCTKMGERHCKVKSPREWKKCPFMPQLEQKEAGVANDTISSASHDDHSKSKRRPFDPRSNR